MCKPQCIIALVFLSISSAYSWDIAVTVADQIEFYQTNGTKINNEGKRFRDLTALAYDAVHNILLFVDRQSDNASIFSYYLATKKYQPLVKRKLNENIQGIAFDPVTSQLFWTDTNEKSIYRKLLKPDVKNAEGTLLLTMDNEIPRAVAVDSCRGYLYWTNTNVTKATIERSRFDGSDRQVIISSEIYMPVSIAIDQNTRTLYWADDKEGIHYSIESSDLEGNNRITLLQGIHHQPNALTVSKDALYWVDLGFKALWKYPKDFHNRTEPIQIVTYLDNEVASGVAANYKITDQIEGVPECQKLNHFASNVSSAKDTLQVNMPTDIGLLCLHGRKVEGKLACQCSPGYTGERCENSLCHNHCLNGDCSLTPEGKPECRCQEGFKGSRCEINICEGHCLNQGSCQVKDQEPVCTCSDEYEGSRCENLKMKEITTVDPLFLKQNETCNCTLPKSSMFEKSVLNEEFVETSSCLDGWDSIRDPIIMVLGILSGLLCVACAVLITKVLKLKRRPRIKKRIIVNKNVTPLTARPDQCEITIENCCNMNICETPCFEPRSTIKPSLLDPKIGKEEKRNLIDNMEYPDD